MSLKVEIIDGAGKGNSTFVLPTGFICVQPTFEPPLTDQKIKPFRQYLTNGGGAADSNDMIVDGGTTNVNFWVPADQTDDRYITVLSVVIADAGNFAQNAFGALSALTNGCRLFYERASGEEIDIHDALKTNFDFTRLALGRPAFGAAATVFRGTNLIGTAEAMLPVVDLKEFMPPFGIKLDKGTNQRLVLTVKDALAGLTTFDIIAYGFDRFE